MLRFFTFVAVAAALCAGGHAQADDEFSSARHYPALATKWNDIQSRMSQDASHLVLCRADPQVCRPEEKRLAEILDASREREGRARLGHINRAVNLAIRPVSDMQRFGVADHWSAPLETLLAGGGDCEDYAILKFLILREAGFADADLKLLIVRPTASPTMHAVLAARNGGEWLVLDNRGFTLARLEDSPYRVLTQFSIEPVSDPAFIEIASAGGSDLPPLL
jgi:predicted transglutaminase-like cysteine proteinase